MFLQVEIRSQGSSCTIVQAQNQASESSLEATIQTLGAMNEGPWRRKPSFHSLRWLDSTLLPVALLSGLLETYSKLDHRELGPSVLWHQDGFCPEIYPVKCPCGAREDRGQWLLLSASPFHLSPAHSAPDLFSSDLLPQ